MSLPLVVLTFPGHFFFTALTVQSFLKHHSTSSEIIIIIDDLSIRVWDSYVKDCEDYYLPFVDKILKTSDFEFLRKFTKSGWIRQQMVKLHLDQMVNSNQCFFTDGDIMFLNTVDPESVPYSIPTPNGITEMNNQYVSELLGIDRPGFYINDQQICVSNPAFRVLDSQMLADLRNHVENRLGVNFLDLHLPYQTQNTASVSEWELIEHFKSHVRGQTPNLIRYAPHDFTHTKYTLDFFSHQFITCYCTDSGIGKQWFEQQGITGLDRYWPVIEKVKK